MSDSEMKRSLSPEADGPLSRKERNTQLESLPEIGYDDKELDTELFKRLTKRYPFINLSSPLSDPSHFLLVLYNIVSSSPALNQSYKDMESGKLDDFFRDHEEILASLLVDGWKRRSFTEIRKLKELQPAVEQTHSQNRQTSTTSINNQVVLNAWEERYEGLSHILLYDNINEMKRGEAYSTTVAIVQSSGTGKSRMVDQQATLVFTLPFCLRPPADAKSFAYPPTDLEVYDYFRGVPSLKVDAVKCHYLRFLACLFGCAKKELEDNFQIQQSYTELARAWRSHLIRRRQDFYASVLHFTKEKNTLDLTKEIDNAKLQLDQLLEQIDNLSSVKCDSDKVKVMLYFDEAHTLTGDQPILEDDKLVKTRKNLYDALCSSLAELYKQPLFTIFLSTNSSLSQLARAGRLANSARASENPGALQAPITETSFDCSPKLHVRPGELTYEDVSEIEFMAQFGRPLFWTLLEAGKKRTSNMTDEIVRLARSKLLCDERLNMTVSQYGTTAQSALLDCRLMLDYAPRHEKALEEEIKLVASHMRLAYSVPQSREYLRSGYSSEPLLAEAAAQQLAQFRRTELAVELGILERISSNDKMVDLGHRGELVARLLLLLAYDRAVEAEYRKDNPSDIRLSRILYSRGCKLITFIKELYRSNLVNVVLDSKPDNVKSSKKFRDAFRDARVRFTHFAKLADESGVTTEAMFAAFVRGMAFVGHNTQALMDFLIPVLLKRDNLSEEVMSCIFVSIKRRLQAGSKNAYEIKAEKLNFFPEVDSEANPFLDDESNPALRPYVTLVMELGVQNRLSLGSRIPTKVERNPNASVRKSKKATEKLPAQNAQFATPSKLVVMEQGRSRRATSKHPRYSIYAYGCSDTVYKVIERDQRSRYTALLQTKDLLGEHPRGEKAREAVRRLKPFWSVGVSCYHWIMNDFLQGGKAQDTIEERLEAGEIDETSLDEDDQ